MTTTAATTVTLTPKAVAMISERVEEHAALTRQIDEMEARKKRIGKEIDELFTREGQGEALLDGATVNGHKVKMICGTTKTLDKSALMRAHGLDQADLDACTTEKPKKPYVRIAAPGAKDDDRD